MHTSFRKNIIFFAYTNIDARLVLLLRALFLFKKAHRQLFMLPRDSTAMADQIKSVPDYNLCYFQVVTLNPASRSAMGGQDADQWDWWAEKWRWVSWQTRGHTHGHSREHDRGRVVLLWGGVTCRGGVPNTHLSPAGTAAGENKKKWPSRDTWQGRNPEKFTCGLFSETQEHAHCSFNDFTLSFALLF